MESTVEMKLAAAKRRLTFAEYEQLLAAIDACIERSTTPKFSLLIERVSRAFDVTPTNVLSEWRGQTIARARHAAMWIMRKTWSPEPSYPDLGRLFARDHTSIMSAVRKVDKEIAAGTAFGLTVLTLAAVDLERLKESA